MIKAFKSWRPIPEDLPRFAIVLFIGALVGFIDNPLQFVFKVFSGWAFHEVGHASASWVTGSLAIPTPFVTGIFPIPYFSLFFPLLMVGAYIWAFKNNVTAIKATAAALFLSSALCTLFVSDVRGDEFVVLAGQLGDLTLSVVAILLFFAEFPEKFNWRKQRYIWCGLGAFNLAFCSEVFYSALSNFNNLPMGAILDFGELFDGESGGDLDRLIRDFGWSAQQLSQFYWRVVICSWSFLLIAVLFIFYRAVSRDR